MELDLSKSKTFLKIGIFRRLNKEKAFKSEVNHKNFDIKFNSTSHESYFVRERRRRIICTNQIGIANPQ